MILAAGLGTRLRPLTNDRPKALVEVGGRTLLEITLARLRSFGIHDVIVNVHHFADLVVEYLNARNCFGMHVEVSREDLLLDTGGGLKKAAYFFPDLSPQEPFLLHNVDVISTIDLSRLVRFHHENDALVTLAVQRRESSRQLLFDSQLQLRGRRAGRDAKDEIIRPRAPERARSAGSGDPAADLQALAFSGIHVLSPRIFERMPQESVFPIIDFYLTLAAQGEKLLAFRADQYYWRDLGRPADLMQAARDFAAKVIC